MVKAKRTHHISFAFILLLSLAVWVGNPVAAQEEEPPKRQTTSVVAVNEYEWWLIRWTDNLIVCQVLIDHDGVPTGEEVNADCSQEVYGEWITTPPCEQSQKGESTFLCLGFYLYKVGFQAGEQNVTIDLPAPSVWLTLTGCSPTPPQNLCAGVPNLLLTGEEPLPNEHITAIHIDFEDQSITCDAEVCEIPLQPTPLSGMRVEFWADSSFGDSSEHFTAQLRVLESGVPDSPGMGGWYVDVLSSQWRGGPVESCAQIWQAFPPIGGPPFWLSTPTQEQLLASDEPYQYLAGRLISRGLVNASECPGNGLLTNGYADACGLSKARPLVDTWQNQFDPRILQVAQELGIPAQLLKNVFAQESQFWPGIFRVAQEFGLGQLTDLGADTVLLWNPAFFGQFCPLVLAGEVCAQGYLGMEEDERAILRGALATQANADCKDCSSGIDLTRADSTIMLFAQGILANCEQVGQTIVNATLSMPGQISSYEDLWRFTLANYNGGPGCLSFAIHSAWGLREPMDWEHVSGHLTPACQGMIAYVDLVAR